MRADGGACIRLQKIHLFGVEFIDISVGELIVEKTFQFTIQALTEFERSTRTSLASSRRIKM